LIIAAALLPPLCMQMFNEIALRQAREADVRDQVLRQARDMAAELDRIIAGVHNALVATAEFPAVKTADPIGCARLLASVSARLALMHDMELVGGDGRSLCDSLGVVSGRDRSTDDSIRLARERGAFVVGGYVVTGPAGRPSLSMAYPLNGTAGHGAVLVADIDLGWLSEQVALHGLPPDSLVTIADRDGVLLLRLPEPELVGTRMQPAFTRLLTAPHPDVLEATARDGVPRIVGYLPPDATTRGLFVSVGFSAAHAYAASDAAAARAYLLIAAGFLAALGLAAWMARGIITRPARAILDTTERWRAGDMTARVALNTPHSEFGRIAQAINGLLDAVATAQSGLRARLAELDAVYDTAPVGLGFIDRDLRFVTVNARLAEISGLPVAEHRGRLARALLPGIADQVKPGVRRALTGASVAPVEVVSEGQGNGDGPRRLLVSYRSAVSSSGQVYGVIVAMQDITLLRRAEASLAETLRHANAELERRVAERTRELEAEVREREAAQAQLQQAQKMEVVGQLTGGVAHDFNNLLTAIVGNLDLAGMRARDRPDLQRLLQGAMRAAERGAALTQRMLAFGRRQFLRFQAVSIPRVLDGMADMLERTIGPQVTIRLELPPGLPPARADLNQLELVFLNLLVNARDAMPDGGVVAVTGAVERVTGGAAHPAGLPPGDYLRIAVRDSGNGMNDETRLHAFEPFFTTKPVGKGSGLGLSMVHGVTVQSGGGAAIESAPGQGTTVTLWFPCAGADVQLPAEPRRSRFAWAGGSGHVLVVDDDADVLAFTAASLADAGYRVTPANGGEEALAVLEQASPDLMIVDLGMPGMSGLQLAAIAGARCPAMRLLIATGYADDGESPLGSLQLPVLGKPFKAADLLARVADLLGADAPAPRADAARAAPVR
jgi:PAS domain S-box-containing protein